jgi:hypothetical protein
VILGYKGRLRLLQGPLVDARLAYGEDNGVRLAGRTSQDTARIARTDRNVAFCRTFVRLIAVMVPPTDERLPTAVLSADRIPTGWESAV